MVGARRRVAGGNCAGTQRREENIGGAAGTRTHFDDVEVGTSTMSAWGQMKVTQEPPWAWIGWGIAEHLTPPGRQTNRSPRLVTRHEREV